MLPVVSPRKVRLGSPRFSRFSAGESITELAEDFGLGVDQVESAIRLEASLLEPTAA
jgi:uncharacterized protein (DUF433 family)